VTRDADVVVVGGGINGVAALRAVARAGLDSLLLEQFELGNPRGSSHGGSRIFRLSYPNTEHARLSLDALRLWRELEHHCEDQLIVHSGSLDFGDEADAIERTFEKLGLSYDIVDSKVVAERWGVATEPGTRHVVQHDGGFFLADRALAALADSARLAGGEISEREKVTAIVSEAAGVTVTTDSRELTAGAVIVAAGPWAHDVLQTLGIPLPVIATRETVVYFSAPEPETLPALVEYPSSANALPDGQAYYSLPAPGLGLKTGLHHAGQASDPDFDGRPDETVVEATVAWVRKRWPGIDPTPLAAETCFYTNTSDARFLIERHGRVVIASACSGHGFKFGPVTGDRAARLALEAVT